MSNSPDYRVEFIIERTYRIAFPTPASLRGNARLRTIRLLWAYAALRAGGCCQADLPISPTISITSPRHPTAPAT